MAFNPMAGRWGHLYKGTPAELSIEPAIAALGLVYRTQFPGYLFGFRFFPDFFLPQIGLVIEIDDKSHGKAEKMEADAERTAYLESRGWKVVRCQNKEALNDPSGTVQSLIRAAGITREAIEAARRRPLSECLPVPSKCPPAVRRKAKADARQARRAAPRP
jgi:very-short-patch-repair endonuclease